MEIHHKPKPVHSWREFLKEYAIIVLGVLTALGAEQAVEWLHWQSEVKTARQSIFAEMAVNNANLFETRIAIAPCLERQADEAGRILDNLQAGRSPGRFTTFHAGYGATLRDTDWQAERSSQALTHFPRNELVPIGRYYAQFDNIRGIITEERDAWRILSVLRDPPKEVPVGDLLRLRAELMTAREDERLLVQDAVRSLSIGRQISIAGTHPRKALVDNFCTLDFEAFGKSIKSDTLAQ